ncbi:MAG TPA: GGDEF domain-containing protein [Methylophilaceae bacterium]|nr:GGDEF domain-containing protein [Methylophilaceae bacterium]
MAIVSLQTQQIAALPPQYSRLDTIIREHQLHAIFQPIVNLYDAAIVGYEGLIRGPSDSPLHSPLMLFQAARECNRAVEIEYLSRAVVLNTYAKLGVSGKLFLNVNPDTLLMEGWRSGETLRCIAASGLKPEQVVIELTENSSGFDYRVLREATQHYRAMGFEIAMDDLGEGFSSLRMWAEIRPDYVKIDKHFIQNIHLDPIKLQFVRSVQEIAKNSGCRIIAEGIESHAELVAVHGLGVAFGQGYHFSHPQARPDTTLAPTIMTTLKGVTPETTLSTDHSILRRTTVANLVKFVQPVGPGTINDEVFAIFEKNAELYSIPVVDGGKPLGLIGRYTMIDRFARRYGKELYGKLSCKTMMDDSPLIVERGVSIQELSSLILDMKPYHLALGFIVVDRGEYLGMGSGHDLLREVTQMQIAAARYANPLTQLPGNVPINEHIEGLLEKGVEFAACYFDIDHFKPYNDVYGFRKGDEIIKLVSKLLQEIAQPDADFIGHIGGDDFFVLFRSADWEARCDSMLKKFYIASLAHYATEDIERGWIEAEDRQGNLTQHPLITLSIGAVLINPSEYASHNEVAAAATVAKKEAKKNAGNTLFVERRKPSVL